jgi:hypothetical protein
MRGGVLKCIAGDKGLQMVTVCLSETLVSTYESTRRHNSEEQHRHRSVLICTDIFKIQYRHCLRGTGIV